MSDLIGSSIGTLLALGGGMVALSARHLMRGVLGLVAVFLGLAAIFQSLGATYLAAGQLLLYVGGVVTLLVLAFNSARTPVQHARGIAGMTLALTAGAVLALALPLPGTASRVDLPTLATTFFTDYGWVLVVALIALSAAVIGAQYALGGDE